MNTHTTLTADSPFNDDVLREWVPVEDRQHMCPRVEVTPLRDRAVWTMCDVANKATDYVAAADRRETFTDTTSLAVGLYMVNVVPGWRSLRKWEQRMFVLFMLAHSSTRHDDQRLRSIAKDALLPNDRHLSAPEGEYPWFAAALYEAEFLQVALEGRWYNDNQGLFDLSRWAVRYAERHLLPYRCFLLDHEWEQVCDRLQETSVHSLVLADLDFALVGAVPGYRP